ncbi:type II secretion system minor pseudopilin [Aeoliella mucimassa]|uniref:General secretion pathway protein K n=1 Tax=Aeoliella mucimassa TaxID=2527972 RepID=A0A518AL32_9BACT|nr:type II secretion system protein GspK [Aeoliella mucimassa]QDU55443.1 General secretion pathway protein K [Aeoliella mucimassa]
MLSSPAIPKRSGSILITVLVVVLMMTITCAAFYDWSFSQYKSSDVGQRQLQTNMAAESGIEYLRYLLVLDEATLTQYGGLTNNPAVMQSTFTDSQGSLAAQAALRYRFTVLSPALDQSYGEYSGIRIGLENESSKLNLNTILVVDASDPTASLGRTLLVNSLPGMTESMADAILDWLDEDDDPRDFGAERDYYSGLSPGYEPQNGPLESLDQLLLVRDVTPELLYGYDRNRNFTLDAAEQQMFALEQVDNSTGSMNRGWSAYLTLSSAEKNLTPEGEAKIDLNSDDLETLHEQLSEILDEEMASFIIAYRQGGAYEEDSESSNAAATGGEEVKLASEIELDYEQGGSVPLESVLDLIGVQTRVVESGQTQRTVVEAAFLDDTGSMAAYLPILMDYCTTNGDAVIPGRLNINQAPRTLLEGMSYTLPTALPPDVVEAIISNRVFEPGINDQIDQSHETWLLTMGLVTVEEMKQLIPMITAGGDVHRAQVVGYYEAEGPYTRLEAIIDASGTTPKVLSIRDLTPLGAGFTVEQLGYNEQVAE